MNSYYLYPNVDEDLAVQSIESMTPNMSFAVSWMKIWIGIDLFEGSNIFAVACEQNVLISGDQAEDAIVKSIPANAWVVRVREPAAFLSSIEIVETLSYENFTVHEIFRASGENDLYVADHRCALLFLNPQGANDVSEQSQFEAVASGEFEVAPEPVFETDKASTGPKRTGDAELDALLDALG
jgi:hypothetical protein